MQICQYIFRIIIFLLHFSVTFLSTLVFRSCDRQMAQLHTSVRGSLNEQLSWLQGKHNAEVELLEDLRHFSRQRVAIEKQYSEVRLREKVKEREGERDGRGERLKFEKGRGTRGWLRYCWNVWRGEGAIRREGEGGREGRVNSLEMQGHSV